LKLLAELKRRNVFRVGLFYVVSAWLIVEVAETVLPLFDVPDGVLRGLVVLLVIGLVPALGLSWIYELTPEGIKRDTGSSADDLHASATGRKLNWATLIVAALAIGLLVADRLSREPASTEPAFVAPQTARSDPEAGPTAPADTQADAASAIPDASIAVLPFADLSPEGDQQYFSDGIAEEILNVLSRIEALSVTSRTSAFAFKSQSELSIPDIAASLGVRHVLEGSVRKAADTIRITAQLIDARSDQRIWSETFDRQLTAQNVFAIQDEIALAITEALARRLDVRIDAAPGAAGGTGDIDAYAAFLAGRDLFINRNYDNLARSIEMLEQAVEADPDFARARGWLAMAYIVAPSWGYLDRDFVALGVSAAETTLAADPANAEALTALGFFRQAHPVSDYVGAIDYYERAIAADPQATTAHLWLAQAWRELGFFDRATAGTQRCLDVDPNYPMCLYTHAEIAAMQGDYGEALARLMKVFASSHQESYPLFLGITARQGDEALLTLMLRELADVVGPGARWMVPELKRALGDEAYDRDAALARFEARLRSEYPESLAASDAYTMTAWRLAFRAYDRVPVSAISAWWWGVGYPGLAESPHRREAMIQVRLPEYWHARGFPPQCRPVGADDFACE
jgi:TolB-like protein/Tfp pilus assembly protein PilF